MEITLNQQEMLQLAKIAGSIKGISDAMDRPIISQNYSKKNLSDMSEEIMTMLRSKVKNTGFLSAEDADKVLKK